MDFNTPLLKGQFVKRYKRFFVDVQLENGEVITAHSPNTGSMKGLLIEGVDAYVTPHNDPKRKLQYTLEILGTEQGGLVGVNTMRPNHIVAEAIENGVIEELSGYETLKKEVKYGKEGKSRIDILLSNGENDLCYVEVKNTTLREEIDGVPTGLFPDSVTTRGLKHLYELKDMVEEGHRAVMVFLLHRDDCAQFMAAKEIDPDYAAALREVIDAGVEALCYATEVTPEGIQVYKKITINI